MGNYTLLAQKKNVKKKEKKPYEKSISLRFLLV